MGWVFTFIGANIDVAKVAAQISVNNYISFNQTNEGTQAMFVKESNARMKFFDKMSKGESKEKLADKYFEEWYPSFIQPWFVIRWQISKSY